MTMELGNNRYGKARVRLLKVLRDQVAHHIFDWTVQILLRGDFDATHITGDNSGVLPTDTMKNTVYSLARRSSATTMEEFAQELVDFLLSRNPQIRSAEVEIKSDLWKRLSIAGTAHPSTFMHGSEERQTARVEHTQGGSPSVTAGFENLILLKTANSGFEGFLRDDLTTLPETADRLLGTAVRASWTYHPGATKFDSLRHTIREAMLATFAAHNSRSVQQTLFAMGEAAIEACSEIDAIDLTLPNRHALLVDLSRFGQDNPNQIFVPTEEPFGYIEARVQRSATA